MPAFNVRCTWGDEDVSDLVFSADELSALKSSFLYEGETDYLDVEPIPYFDRFETLGDVPVFECLARGWTFECFGCGVTICDDMEDDETGYPRDCTKAVGFLKGRIYCCTECRDDDMWRAAMQSLSTKRTILSLKELAVKAYGGNIRIVDDKSASQAEWHFMPCTTLWAKVYFEFPGMKIGPVHMAYSVDPDIYGPSEPKTYVPSGDVEAFKQFVEFRKDEIDRNRNQN